MKPDGLRILGWVIPILCMTVGGWFVYKEQQAFLVASDATRQSHRDAEKVAAEKKMYDELPPSRRYASVEDKPQEETEFLNYIRTRSQADGVIFDKWLSQTIEYGKDKLSQPKDDKTAALIKGIRKKSGSCSLTGTYSNIRNLIGELESNDRLFTMSGLTWTTAKTGTVLSMTLSRYVSPPKPVTAAKSPTPNPGVNP